MNEGHVPLAARAQGVMAVALAVTAYGLVYLLPPGPLPGEGVPLGAAAGDDRRVRPLGPPRETGPLKPPDATALAATGAPGPAAAGPAAAVASTEEEPPYRPTHFLGVPVAPGVPASLLPRRSGPREHVAHSLVAEAARLERREGGAFIDLGTPDQHKYLDLEWGVHRFGFAQEGESVYLQVNQGWQLAFTDWEGGIRSVILMVRAGRTDERMTVEVDGESLGSQPLPEEWGLLEFRLKAPSKPGRRWIRFTFVVREAPHTPAHVDWIWLRAKDGDPPKPGKTGVLSFGDPRRALLADTPRTYSYHLPVPPQAALTFDVGAKVPMRFEVWATADDLPRHRLFGTTATKQWTPFRVDLKPLSGKLVRLDFVTSGGSGTAGWGDPEVVVPGPEPVVRAVTAGREAKNLVQVVVDAARQDHFRPFVPSSLVAMPVMEGIAREATLFPQAYCPANWTLPSAASILTGRYPSALDDSRGLFKVPASAPLLSQHLKHRGFTTCGVVANRFVGANFGFRRGWDHFREYPEEGSIDTDGKQVFDDAIQWLERLRDRKKRFYLYVHTMEPHVPYRFHKGITEQFLKTKEHGQQLSDQFDADHVKQFNEGRLKLNDVEQEYVRALYRGELVYHDRLLKRLLDTLKRLGLMDSTLLVVHNDHGEELFDHGQVDHGHTLYEELMLSPLMVRYPPLFPPGLRVDRPVELVDLLPTVLESLGLPLVGGLHGESLRRAMVGARRVSDRYAVTGNMDRAVRVGRYKLIATPDGRKLFDLAQDPGERVDLALTHSVARRGCEVYLREGVFVPEKHLRLHTAASRDVDAPTGQDIEISPELRRQLQALGYIQ